MYQVVEGNLRMTENEACMQYPNSFILLQMDSINILNATGVVLYVGDDGDELFSLQVKLNIPLGVVIEGLNHRRSLGGVVVGG